MVQNFKEKERKAIRSWTLSWIVILTLMDMVSLELDMVQDVRYVIFIILCVFLAIAQTNKTSNVTDYEMLNLLRNTWLDRSSYQ